MKQYRAIGMGGTFDHFHSGHRHFLDFAAALADTLVVGITTPELSTHKVSAEQIESFEQRQKSVEEYLTQNNIAHEIFRLNDVYGPTLQAGKVDAIAVTEQTVSGGAVINAQRSTLGLPELPVHVCSLLHDLSGELISSTRVRRGKINRAGLIYATPIQDGLVLTPEQSAAFTTAQGPVVLTVDPTQLTMPTLVVGDIVSETFVQHHWPASLYIFDRRSARKQYESATLQELVAATSSTTIANPAGQISKDAVTWLQQFCDNLTAQQMTTPSVLQIEGEEDLITVAIVLLAPLGVRLYYGQPHQGMIELQITEAVKERFYQPFAT